MPPALGGEIPSSLDTKMITRFCDLVTSVARCLMWLGFSAMIVTVALQVIARNIIHAPMIWTTDVAQMLFTWLIFIGAAVGLRTGAHYRVDLISPDNKRANQLVDMVCFVGGVAVALLLLCYGWELALMRDTASIQSLSLSQFWLFLSMPVCGALMLLYMAESFAKAVQRTSSSQRSVASQ